MRRLATEPHDFRRRAFDSPMKRLIQDAVTILRMPSVSINLMHAGTARNDPFYGRIVREFFAQTQKRHRKLPVIRALEYGVALCELPASFDEYFMAIESAARRNVKKAQRIGYTFQRIEFNQYLTDVGEIRRSTDQRQGTVPASFGEVTPCRDPPSTTPIHDYAYFGIIKDGKLRAYAACLISGELCMVEHILGHADYQQDGVVPMLITGICRELFERFPSVKYYAYGTYFGGGITLRRFKKKFGFTPHRIRWVLG
jgi:hypothetical protein